MLSIGGIRKYAASPIQSKNPAFSPTTADSSNNPPEPFNHPNNPAKAP